MAAFLLALTSFDFVAPEVLFSLGVNSVLTSNWIILFKADLFGSVLRVLGSVVRTVTAKLTH